MFPERASDIEGVQTTFLEVFGKRTQGTLVEFFTALNRRLRVVIGLQDFTTFVMHFEQTRLLNLALKRDAARAESGDPIREVAPLKDSMRVHYSKWLGEGRINLALHDTLVNQLSRGN
jgi:hypothetical protein